MNYYDFKREYVSSGTFQTLTGDYTGYVDVLSGVPYVYNTKTTLTSLGTFETDLLTSSHFRNRSVDDAIDLPYSESSILFQPNDYLTGSLLNDKFNKLQENNTYLYSRMFMADNNLPVSDNLFYFGLTGTNDTSFKKYNNYSATIPFFNSANYGYLSSAVGYTAVLNAEIPNMYALFVITNNNNRYYFY